MSFFDNTKIAGWGLFLCAILMIISAIISIYNGAVKEGDDRLALVVAGIGALLAAFIYFGFGNSVRKGEISKKIDVLAQFVKTVGVAPSSSRPSVSPPSSPLCSQRSLEPGESASPPGPTSV